MLSKQGRWSGVKRCSLIPPVLTIMLRVPLLLFWYSRERGVYCLRVLLWRQKKGSEFSTSQKCPPRDRSVQSWVFNLTVWCQIKSNYFKDELRQNFSGHQSKQITCFSWEVWQRGKRGYIFSLLARICPRQLERDKMILYAVNWTLNKVNNKINTPLPVQRSNSL